MKNLRLAQFGYDFSASTPVWYRWSFCVSEKFSGSAK